MVTSAIRQDGKVRDQYPAEAIPLVSIIVVVFQDKTELEKVMDNLARFRGKDVEIIIIDGGSSDGSKELLQANSHRVDYWVSEADSGIYHAMNKGLQAARGSWVLHINAGDRLLSIPFDELRSLDESIAIFGCRVEHPTDKFTFIPRMNWTFRFQTTLQHQGTFYRRTMHCGYDSSYRVLGDVAATQRLVRQGKRVAISAHVVSSHEGGGLSDLPGNDAEWSRSIRENYGVLHQYAHKFLFIPARRMYYSLRKRFR